MSIIVACAGTSATAAANLRSGAHIHPDVRGLLDHLAVELAEEYVRLMEAVADAERPQHEPADRNEEDENR